MQSSLTIERFTLGPWQTNCYLIADQTGECWIIDAGFEPTPMIEFVERHGLSAQQIVLTHAHVDHIGGLAEMLDRLGPMPVLIHEAESEFPEDPTLNLSAFINEPLHAPEPTDLLRHGQTLALGSHRFEVRHTPGHSPGGITLYSADQTVALVGDTLFQQAIGRTDFPTSDPPALERSIRQQLYTLPNDTRVLPGHMESTTIGAEKRSNPFVPGN